MGWNDFALIIATFLGPVGAVQAQQWLERWRDDRNRRLQVFKTLMATRGAVLSPAHVQALNSIDLEYLGDEFKAVRSAWKLYLDHLNNYPKGDPVAGQAATPGAIEQWAATSPDLLTALLVAMGKSLGYSFDQVDIKRGVYTPLAHGQDENDWRHLRWLLLKVFSGQSALKMDVATFPSNPDAVKAHIALLENMNAALKGGALSVEVTHPAETKP